MLNSASLESNQLWLPTPGKRRFRDKRPVQLFYPGINRLKWSKSESGMTLRRIQRLQPLDFFSIHMPLSPCDF